MWAPETRSESWRSLITTSPSEMSFASIRAIVMRCRGCLRFRSCPIVGEDGQSIWLDGSPNPIHDAAAAESAVAWMAVSELAPQPVSFYAAVFFLVNATYILLIRELIDCSPLDDLPVKVRTSMTIAERWMESPDGRFGLALARADGVANRDRPPAPVS